jgi:hypothetical protein
MAKINPKASILIDECLEKIQAFSKEICWQKIISKIWAIPIEKNIHVLFQRQKERQHKLIDLQG